MRGHHKLYSCNIFLFNGTLSRDSLSSVACVFSEVNGPTRRFSSSGDWDEISWFFFLLFIESNCSFIVFVNYDVNALPPDAGQMTLSFHSMNERQPSVPFP